MTILLDRETRVLVQGITGTTGRGIAARMHANGTPIVAGVTPGKGGGQAGAVPIFDSCYEAVARTGANASFVAVPPGFVLDACYEAADAGIQTIVIYCEGVPVADAVRLARFGRDRGVVIVGPNAAGCISPGIANLSDLNEANVDPGRVGIVSKSGTLAYEAIDALRRHALGVSTAVCLGGDAVPATTQADILRLFETDRDTDIVVMLGEIGGRSELEAAEVVRSMTKPTIAYIAGRHAPAGKRMGHAGAVLRTPDEGWAAKTAALADAGAIVVNRINDVAAAAAKALEPAQIKRA